MRRREFIAVIGSAGAWPVTALARQDERVRRIGVLMNIAADGPEAPGQLAAVAQGLAERGWTIGGNIEAEYRWYAADACVAQTKTLGITIPQSLLARAGEVIE